jgi:hypothetical protein
VYSDHQRLELEKEFHYSRYITIRRKAELAANLGLSERQVSQLYTLTYTFNIIIVNSRSILSITIYFSTGIVLSYQHYTFRPSGHHKDIILNKEEPQ